MTLSFPSGRNAEEVIVDDDAGLAWVVNLGCIELHPHAIRESDLEHPDELRIDLDPTPGVKFADDELVGIPHRVVVGDKGLERGVLEYKRRRDGHAAEVPVAEVVAFVKSMRNRREVAGG